MRRGGILAPFLLSRVGILGYTVERELFRSFTMAQILIVEDDPDIAMLFFDTLVSSGHEVEIARNGQLALDRLQEVTPHLIILDMHLPQISGPQVLAYIRNDERLCNIPVIVATADARIGESMQNDADIVLIKPVSPQQLRDLANRIQAKLS
jgi:CheY-like chemotaxis protein